MSVHRLPDPITPDILQVSAVDLVLKWPTHPSPSIYKFDWLEENAYNPPVNHTSLTLHKAHLWDQVAWNANEFESASRVIGFQDFMEKKTEFYAAIEQLRKYGLVLLQDVPCDKDQVGRVANRFGDIRYLLISLTRSRTFYGEFWDVKRIPEAKNIAYTQKELDLHMDLLYLESVPGFPFSF